MNPDWHEDLWDKVFTWPSENKPRNLQFSLSNGTRAATKPFLLQRYRVLESFFKCSILHIIMELLSIVQSSSRGCDQSWLA